MTRQQWQNGAHAVLAVASAVAIAVSGSAFVISGLITLFGGHVSGMDIMAKAAGISTGALTLSKLIDSANNALGGTSAPAAPPVINAATIHAPFVPTPVPPSPGT